MWKILVQSLKATLLIGVLVCGIYPLIVTLAGKLLFSESANGSFILDASGKQRGSRLIGQAFTRPEYFHGRPSAAGTGYDAANSSGSNLGPTNQKLADALRTNIDGVLKENPSLKSGEVPTDLVTASASGLDPDVTPSGALAQVERVARARSLNVDAVRALVNANVRGPELGFLGESVVNVLDLNLALDALKK